MSDDKSLSSYRDVRVVNEPAMDTHLLKFTRNCLKLHRKWDDYFTTVSKLQRPLDLSERYFKDFLLDFCTSFA